MVATEAKGASEAWSRVKPSEGYGRVVCFVCGAIEAAPRDMGDGLVTAVCDRCASADPAALIRRPHVIPGDRREAALRGRAADA
jgi:hypothetical protein